MPQSRGYEDLIAWRKAIELSEAVYEIIVALPRDERFELSSQLRRAIVSVGANIAEGSSRHGAAEFLHFIGIALGSLAEVDTLLVIGARVHLLPEDEVNRIRDQVTEERRILRGLAECVRRKLPNPGQRHPSAIPRESA